MDVRRLRVGEWLAGIGGAVLLGSMFFGWYGVDEDRTFEGPSSSGVLVAWGEVDAWEAFSVVDVILALAAALAIALAVMTAAQRSGAVPVALASLLGSGAVVATLLVLWRVLDPPSVDISQGGVSASTDDLSREPALFVALGACLAMVAGAFAAMKDERYPEAARANVPIETLSPPEGGAA